MGETLKKHLPQLQIFFTIMDFFTIKNVNNLTGESTNADTKSLNISNKYRDPVYFSNL